MGLKSKICKSWLLSMNGATVFNLSVCGPRSGNSNVDQSAGDKVIL